MDMKKASMIYWFPILLPILLGILYALVKLPYDTSLPLRPETMGNLTASSDNAKLQETLNNMLEQLVKLMELSINLSLIERKIIIDIFQFLDRLCEGITTSVIAIDIWAFTTLYNTRKKHIIRLPYEYPVLGIIVHIILMMVVAFFQELAKLERYRNLMISIVAAAALGSILVSWLVRDGIWRKFEILIEDTGR